MHLRSKLLTLTRCMPPSFLPYYPFVGASLLLLAWPTPRRWFWACDGLHWIHPTFNDLPEHLLA